MVFFSIAFAISIFFLSWLFLAALLVYFVLTLSYSLFLKRKAILDVFVLTILYILRIIAGAVAIHVTLSSWLLGFALFFFLSLAYLKRFIEVKALKDLETIKGRGYHKKDQELLKIIGVSSGILSALVMSLYINSDVVFKFYHYPQGLWLTALLLLYWINYIWHAAVHDLVDDDPIAFVLKDRTSLIVVALVFLVVILSQIQI